MNAEVQDNPKSKNQIKNPKSADPALAKAGVALGTTVGMELFFLPNPLHFPRANQATAPSVHRPGATQATAISVHFPRATHAAAISVFTAFQNAIGRGRPFLQLQQSLRSWQCPFKEVQGCRLPARTTPQILPCSSQEPLRLSCSSNSP